MPRSRRLFRLQLWKQNHVADVFLAGQSRARRELLRAQWKPFGFGCERPPFPPLPRLFQRELSRGGFEPAPRRQEPPCFRPETSFSRSPCFFSNWNRPASGWNGRRSDRNGRASERKCGFSMVTAIIPIGIGPLPTGMAVIPAGTALFPAGTGLAGSEAAGLGLELACGDPEK